MMVTMVVCKVKGYPSIYCAIESARKESAARSYGWWVKLKSVHSTLHEGTYLRDAVYRYGMLWWVAASFSLPRPVL